MSDVIDSPSGNADDTTVVGGDWRANLQTIAPEYVREWDEYKNADSPDKFFKQLADHRKMIGQSIRIPGQDAGPEQLGEFYSKLQSKVPGLMRTPNPDDSNQVMDALRKLGHPEKADDYAVGDNLGFDSEALGMYRALAHEAGLTKAQFKVFAEKLAERVGREKETAEAARAEDAAGLRGEWGPAYEQRLGVCAKIAQRTGAPAALVDAIQKGTADTQTLKWLHGLSTQFGKEGVNFVSEQDAMPTTADVQGKIDDMMGNNDHPYWNAGHPDHERAVDRMLELRRQLASAR